MFDRNGRFEDAWSNVHRPCAVYIDNDQRVYVAELGYGNNVSKDVPNIGPRISVLNQNGKVLDRIGHLGYGFDTGQFAAPHGLCLDSELNIYVAEVARTNMSHYTTPPETLRSFQKLQKV